MSQTKLNDNAILFPLGRLVATPGAIAAVGHDPQPFAEILKRHMSGDWGDLCDEDKRMNDAAVYHDNDRILSRYDIDGTDYYIITERDRSATTILLPEEY